MEKIILGENSYPVIVKNIVEKLQNAKGSTLQGDEFLKQMYKSLNESKTPIMDIKPFITGAEKLERDDKTLKEVLDFCKKSITTGDLNFLINLAKEEHFQKLIKSYHPAPETTIKDIKEKFNDPSSVIEQGIIAGIFDDLKSDLLNQIKVDLGVPQKLNENTDIRIKNSLISYNPIGLKYDDKSNNRIVLLLESDTLSYEKGTDKFSSIENVEVDLEHKSLMEAINICPYNIETCEFSLNENWDFQMRLNSEGKVVIGEKIVKKEDVKAILFESINLYETYPTKVNNFNKANYLKAADKFIMLVENADLLIKFDNLVTIKNLNENSYVLLNKDDVFNVSTPEILSSSASKNTKLFESYGLMLQETNKILKDEISDLFESQMKNEKVLFDKRNDNIVSLNESIGEINTQITHVQELKNMAEKNSPALENLNEQENKLNGLLNQELNNLNYYKNNFKLY